MGKANPLSTEPTVALLAWLIGFASRYVLAGR